MDVYSVKIHPKEVFEAHLVARGADLILTHPLFGPDSASGGLAGLPIALHNLGASREVFDHWVRRFRELGLTPVIRTPEEHDRAAAYSRGLTHLILPAHQRAAIERQVEFQAPACHGFGPQACGTPGRDPGRRRAR